MKHESQNDSLDQKIDALFAQRPLQPSDDFTARVLAATEAPTRRSHPVGKLLAFALPLAAAIAVTFSLLQLSPSSDTPSNEALTASETDTSAITSAEAHEIFLLEESLSSLAAIDSTEFKGTSILSTLDALYL